MTSSDILEQGGPLWSARVYVWLGVVQDRNGRSSKVGCVSVSVSIVLYVSAKEKERETGCRCVPV